MNKRKRKQLVRSIAPAINKLIKKTMKMNTCPICNKDYQPGTEALSRRSNTAICSTCGTNEALEDYQARAKENKDQATKQFEEATK